MSFYFSRKALIAGGISFFGGILFLFWLLHYISSRDQLLDSPIQKSLAQIQTITSYTQDIQTETKIDTKSLVIKGLYINDYKNNTYLSYSTTTLVVAGDATPHLFTHQNISQGDTIYLRVQTQDLLLKNSIQSTSEWQKFKNTSIPQKFAGIAIAGPIQDNLSLLSQNGAYLILHKKYGRVRFKDETLLRYTFSLSKKTATIPEGPLRAVVGRIGSGTIDVWIDPQNFQVRHLLFTNTPYISTTTISNINTPPLIGIPTTLVLQ